LTRLLPLVHPINKLFPEFSRTWFLWTSHGLINRTRNPVFRRAYGPLIPFFAGCATPFFQVRDHFFCPFLLITSPAKSFLLLEGLGFPFRFPLFQPIMRWNYPKTPPQNERSFTRYQLFSDILLTSLLFHTEDFFPFSYPGPVINFLTHVVFLLLFKTALQTPGSSRKFLYSDNFGARIFSWSSQGNANLLILARR